MKSYVITVNGVAYDVTVEETGSAPSAPVARAAAPAPAAPAMSAPKAAAGGAGAVKIPSPLAGKVLSIKADVGTAVKKGDVIMILEAMKMENEIVAPQDGTIASMTAPGTAVEAGDILGTMN